MRISKLYYLLRKYFRIIRVYRSFVWKMHHIIWSISRDKYTWKKTNCRWKEWEIQMNDILEASIQMAVSRMTRILNRINDLHQIVLYHRHFALQIYSLNDKSNIFSIMTYQNVKRDSRELNSNEFRIQYAHST